MWVHKSIVLEQVWTCAFPTYAVNVTLYTGNDPTAFEQLALSIATGPWQTKEIHILF